MTYRIRGLDPTPYRPLIRLSDGELAAQGVVRMTVDSKPGFPCRVTLDDLEPGTSALLLNHVSHGEGPYRAIHAIFVSENARPRRRISRIRSRPRSTGESSRFAPLARAG